MTPIADDFNAIRAALAALEGAERLDESAAPAPRPGDLCDDDEITEAYLLWCGGAC